MKHGFFRLVTFFSLLCSVVLAAPAYAADVTIFAAASLKPSLDPIASAFTQETGLTTAVSYGGSNMLAKQIEQGAPADIVISADTDWMDYLDTRKLIRTETRVMLLKNRLALIAPAASMMSLTLGPDAKLAEALGDGRLAMADIASVPAGKYGKAALEKLGLWSSVSEKLSQSDNVRGALAFVARGEAPLGIVYRTDAISEPKVRIVSLFPEVLHPPIFYPAAVTTAAHIDVATRFMAYLTAPASINRFIADGFEKVP